MDHSKVLLYFVLLSVTPQQEMNQRNKSLRHLGVETMFLKKQTVLIIPHLFCKAAQKSRIINTFH